MRTLDFRDHQRTRRQPLRLRSREPASRGLSIGLNLNPDKVCNRLSIRQVDRTTPGGPRGRSRPSRIRTRPPSRTGRRGSVVGPPFDTAAPHLRVVRNIASLAMGAGVSASRRPSDRHPTTGRPWPRRSGPGPHQRSPLPPTRGGEGPRGLHAAGTHRRVPTPVRVVSTS